MSARWSFFNQFGFLLELIIFRWERYRISVPGGCPKKNLSAAGDAVYDDIQVQVRRKEGYDHSYYFLRAFALSITDIVCRYIYLCLRTHQLRVPSRRQLLSELTLSQQFMQRLSNIKEFKNRYPPRGSNAFHCISQPHRRPVINPWIRKHRCTTREQYLVTQPVGVPKLPEHGLQQLCVLMDLISICNHRAGNKISK
jgi:hypothetical protein